ncbi:MAG: TonB-dependent receptor [Sphingomonadales bacterium]|nr:TonB-dependent receptor [Sphingomonadales bacterium]
MTHKLRAILMAAPAACALSMPALSVPAYAQRADENATTSAEDGFGSSVGNESVGIYASGTVRGFSAYDAGNARIEGLYFNESGGITDLIQTGSDIRVGLTSFGYPFPAPTGIVDSKLSRIDSARPILSARISSGQYLGPDVTAELAVPVNDTFGVKGAIGYFDEQYGDGASAWFVSYGGVTRWRPESNVEVTGFFSRYDYGDEEQGPVIFTSGDFLPQQIKRREYFGQDWAQWAGHSQNIGGFVKSDLGNLKIEAGLFNSRFTQDRYAAAWFDDVGEDGIGQEYVLAGQDQRFASTSGELRLSRSFREGPRLHRVIASLRGRDVEADFAGFQLFDLGMGPIGVQDAEELPDFTFGALTNDIVRQRNYSLGYDLRWQGVGELNLGLTRTDYLKVIEEPALPVFRRRDRLWLWNAGIAFTLTPKLSVYAAATRGLEETGSAPGNAANANELLPALRTRQMEAGLRYRLPGSFTLVAAGFDIRKPYFETDSADNVFRILGEVRHRGVELSLSGEPVKGLSIVTGAQLLDPKVTGEAVADGRLGAKPLGRTPVLITFNADYRFPKIEPLSLDLAVTYEGDRTANIANTLEIPARATIDLGARYRLKLGRSPATLRLQARNLTNAFGWRVFSGGSFKPINRARSCCR